MAERESEEAMNKEKLSFLDEVRKKSGQNLNLCYQCLKCTAGCPTAGHMDIKPNSIIRLLQMGMEEEFMKSRSLWLCVACGTCGTRCPNGIDIAAIMDTVREIAIKRNIPAREKNIHLLHEAFVRSIKRGGRVHEATMLIDYKIRSGDFLTDLVPGMKLFFKGKIPILPVRIKGKKDIQRIYKKCEE